MEAASYLHSPIRLILSLLCSGLLCACAPTTPQWDKQFGDSVRQTRAHQIMNPQAGSDAPVNGVEGTVARESIARYRSSFREPPQAPVPLTNGTGR